MSAREWREWAIYYRMEPFGSWRDNYHSAQLAMIMANSNRKKSSRPFELTQFFYQDPKRVVEQKDESTLAFFDRFVDPDEEELN